MFDTETTNFNNNSLFDTNNELNNDAYGLESLSSTQPSVGHIEGTLNADIFTLNTRYDVNIISGNGNVEFGAGYYDVLDLSNISVDDVVNSSFAEVDEGGVIFDLGNGDRVFDYLQLSDGTEVLFEGLDGIVFSDQEINLTTTPDDPYYQAQWNLHMMGVQNAWRFTTGSDDVLIGVQDTGLGVDGYGDLHEDLNIDHTLYYNGDNNGFNGNLADDFFRQVTGDSYAKSTSHGTAVQGIIAAETDNGIGVAGINWNSQVYNIDVLDGNTGDLSVVEATQAMIKQADSQGQNLVINMSLGSDSFGTLASYDADFEQIVADNPNVLFVIAAGNSGNEGREGLASPAVLAKDYDNVIAVGASWGTYDYYGYATTPGTRIEYDSWGSQYGEGLTLMGPSEVYTTDANTTTGFAYESQFNGTSAATPNVTGVASLLWSANKDLTAAEIKEILSQTAYDLGTAGYDEDYGYGFINADAAVRRAIALKSTSTSTTSLDVSVENTAFSLPGITEIINNAPLSSFDVERQTTVSLDNAVNLSNSQLDVADHNESLPVDSTLFDDEAVEMTEVVDLGDLSLQNELFANSLIYAQLQDELIVA
jgi:hypothetical protein